MFTGCLSTGRGVGKDIYWSAFEATVRQTCMLTSRHYRYTGVSDAAACEVYKYDVFTPWYHIYIAVACMDLEMS